MGPSGNDSTGIVINTVHVFNPSSSLEYGDKPETRELTEYEAQDGRLYALYGGVNASRPVFGRQKKVREVAWGA